MKSRKWFLVVLVMGLFGSAGFGIYLIQNRDPRSQDDIEEGDYRYSYDLIKAFPQISFSAPVEITHPVGNTTRLYVVDQAGYIYSFSNNASVTESQIFLDLSADVFYSGEMGLLSMAFHPNFTSNGKFYVYYAVDQPDLQTILSEFTINASNPVVANRSSETQLLVIDQPFANHNGGEMTFGPDEYLYLAIGDGGSGGDPYNNSQNLMNLLGSIIRINVAGQPYSIPEDNPFYENTQGYRSEIFAYGFRNPWRFSFDNETGDLWVADVGQNDWEEINVVEKGGNYGWNYMEGTHYYTGQNSTNLALPIYEYGHDQGQSITGGYVYRGNKLEGLSGKYVFGDYSAGKIWALNLSKEEETLQVENRITLFDTGLSIPSFGIDAEGDFYALAFDGYIYKLTETKSLLTESTSDINSSSDTTTSSITTTTDENPNRIPAFPFESLIISIIVGISINFYMKKRR